MANHLLRSIIASHILDQAKNGTQLFKMAQPRSQIVYASKLVFAEYGEPIKVIKKEDEELTDVKPQEVLIKMLAAPVNPADINTIQGRYPTKPKLPAVGGNEGVGEVMCVGNDVKNLQPGDKVVPLLNALGTWRTHAIFDQNHVYKVPNDLGIIEAATFTVNPATAYRMLKDFACLKPDDVIIQNGGNSAVGQYAIQLCREWGIRSVNIVRNRPNIEELRSYLTDLGATCVLTEEELRTTDLFKSKTLPRPKLALNCIGGKSSTEIMRQLETGGTIVTYGGMSREPVTVAISALIFKDVNVRGFWMTRWSNKNADSSERYKMFEELIDLMRNGKVKGPANQLVAFENYTDAFNNTLTAKGMVGKKYIFDFK